MLTVIESDEVHFVADEDGNHLAGPFDSNSQAWRWIDHHEGDPISKSEATAQWSWEMYCGIRHF